MMKGYNKFNIKTIYKLKYHSNSKLKD